MASNYSFDDVFDEESEDNILEAKQWAKLRENRVTDGYRNGLHEGQELLLQQGFNQGFQQACPAVYDVARLRGIMSALVSHHLSLGDQLVEGSTVQELQQLLEEVSSLEGQCLKTSRKDHSTTQQADSPSEDRNTIQQADSSSEETQPSSSVANPGDEKQDSGCACGNSQTCCKEDCGEQCAAKHTVVPEYTAELDRLKASCAEILSRLKLQISV